MVEYYLIHTKNNGTFATRGNFDSVNATTVGSTNNYTFYLSENFGDKTYTSDTTIDATEVLEYDNITVNAGVTLTINGILQCDKVTNNGTINVNGELIVTAGDVISKLLSYGEYAGKYNTSTMVDATMKYTDRIPDSESIDSLVVGIEPASDLQTKDVVGAWGIIDSIQDLRTGPLGEDRIAFEITTLAKYSDFGDVNGVEDKLKLT